MSEADYWPHAPLHLLGASGTYFVTGSTYLRHSLFKGRARLEVLHRGLLKVARQWNWHLEAWAVFANHYHFVGHSPRDEEDARSLRPMLTHLHEQTGSWINRQDGAGGRQVWFNFRETQLTYQRSYFARLSYVHRNAVKHRLVQEARDYPWCSAAWFERTATRAQVRTLKKFDGRGVRVSDDFEVPDDW